MAGTRRVEDTSPQTLEALLDLDDGPAQLSFFDLDRNPAEPAPAPASPVRPAADQPRPSRGPRSRENVAVPVPRDRFGGKDVPALRDLADGIPSGAETLSAHLIAMGAGDEHAYSMPALAQVAKRGHNTIRRATEQLVARGVLIRGRPVPGRATPYSLSAKAKMQLELAGHKPAKPTRPPTRPNITPSEPTRRRKRRQTDPPACSTCGRERSAGEAAAFGDVCATCDSTAP